MTGWRAFKKTTQKIPCDGFSVSGDLQFRANYFFDFADLAAVFLAGFFAADFFAEDLAVFAFGLEVADAAAPDF